MHLYLLIIYAIFETEMSTRRKRQFVDFESASPLTSVFSPSPSSSSSRRSKKSAKSAKPAKPTKSAKSTKPAKFKCKDSNVNMISSFASTFIREYVKKTPNHIYGELDDDNSKCFLYDSNGNEKKMTKQAIYKELKKKKKTHYFIVKVLPNAPQWYYPAHWYFQTPFSLDDNTKMMENSDTIWQGSKPLKEPKRTLNNSYALQWQINRSNQFCMLYALYGLMSKNIHIHPFKPVKMLKDSEIEAIPNGTSYHTDPNQNKNTSALLTFFTSILQEHTDLFESPLQTAPLLKVDHLLAIQRMVIQEKHAKTLEKYKADLKTVNQDKTMSSHMKKYVKEEMNAVLEQKKEESRILKSLTKQDIIDELENAVHCPAQYSPQF